MVYTTDTRTLNARYLIGQFDVTLNGEVIFSMIRTEKNVTAEQVSKRLLEILNQKKYTSMEQPPSSGNAGPSDTSQQARSEGVLILSLSPSIRLNLSGLRGLCWRNFPHGRRRNEPPILNGRSLQFLFYFRIDVCFCNKSVFQNKHQT